MATITYRKLNNDVTINGGVVKCFIVPNAIDKHSLDGEYTSEFNIRRINRWLDANNVGYHLGDPGHEEIRTVEIWFHSEDFHCENMSDHLFGVKDAEGHKHYGRIDCALVPVEFIKGLREGESKELNIPIIMDRKDDAIDYGVLRTTILAGQLNYRYRRFGAFHEVMTALGA